MKERLIRPFATGSGQEMGVFARIPTDLTGLTVFVLGAATLLAVVDVTSPVIRAFVGFPLLFLAPGYAIVSILFPRGVRADRDETLPVVGRTETVTETERVALSFGLSFAVLPLLGLGIAATSWQYTTSVVVWTVSGFVLAAILLAAVRRARVSPADRYRFELLRKLGALRAAIFDTRSSTTTAINLLLVVSMVIALTSVGYALAAPQDDEQYTDLRLLTETDDGEYVAGDLPDSVESGESIPLIVTVENQEGEHQEYTAVVQEQWVDDGEVLERTELRQIDYTLGDGTTGHGDRTVTPDADAGEVRIAVMLFDDEVPETPTTDDAYRYTHFWIEIEDDDLE
ncbi:DUF1616 domain-containing protein [Natronobacterium texcoconense]|uniref:Uncharacterized membrane protein n=1 Tax=Natronobacterium texcoconense TaxID=1095778 RepID=A0A1H1F7W8_NATTX|nr:DUF1616 domain-containing protein [Natronobacterium texcoconense]SDQ96536.1 Uncharacterized membrane protein [Natronobacterium texcoconense]